MSFFILWNTTYNESQWCQILFGTHCVPQKKKSDRLWPTWGWVNAKCSWVNADRIQIFLVNYPFKTLKDVLYGEYLMLSCLNIAQSVAKTLKFSPSSKLQRCNPFRLSQTCMFVAFFRPYHVARLLSVCSLIMCPIFFRQFPQVWGWGLLSKWASTDEMTGVSILHLKSQNAICV